MSLPEKLEIHSGGRLIASYWCSDRREYDCDDITQYAHRHLFENCVLADDVTIKDIFLILNTNLELFDTIFGNWCKELVKEALSPRIAKPNEKSDIEYLELYFSVDFDRNENLLQGLHLPDFHGVGPVLKVDDPENGVKAGERINWGLSFTPPYEIIHLPLRLKKDCTIFDTSEVGEDKEMVHLSGMAFTLGQVLLAPIWELSFHGSPQSRENKKNDLYSIVESIKSSGGY